MMPAYDSLMKMRAGASGGMQATPVHHILEEKANPQTGEKMVVGSNWREKTSQTADKLRAMAYDPTVPMHLRKAYQQKAQNLGAHIATEDAWHNQQAIAEDEMLADEEEAGAITDSVLAREMIPGNSPYQGLMSGTVPGNTGIMRAGQRMNPRR